MRFIAHAPCKPTHCFATSASECRIPTGCRTWAAISAASMDSGASNWVNPATEPASSRCSGVGTLLAGEADLLKDVVFGVLRSLLSWAVWALLAWFVGSKILGTQDTQADWGQLARGTGFAQTPGILKVLIFIPILGVIIELVAALWQFAAMVIAVRQSLDYTSTLRAFAVVLISFVPVVIINGIVIWALRIGGTPVPPA